MPRIVRRIRMRLVLTFLAIATLAGVALARPMGDCGSNGQPALGIVQVTAGTADSTFYIDDRNYVAGNGVWLYLESNGLWTEKPAGVYLGDPTAQDLQRGPSGCEPMFDTCIVEVCYDTESDWNGPDLLIL